MSSADLAMVAETLCRDVAKEVTVVMEPVLDPLSTAATIRMVGRYVVILLSLFVVFADRVRQLTLSSRLSALRNVHAGSTSLDRES